MLDSYDQISSPNNGEVCISFHISQFCSTGVTIHIAVQCVDLTKPEHTKFRRSQVQAFTKSHRKTGLSPKLFHPPYELSVHIDQ